MLKSFGLGFYLNRRNNIGKVLVTTVTADFKFNFYSIENIQYSYKHRFSIPHSIAELYKNTDSKIFVFEKIEKKDTFIETICSLSEYLIRQQNQNLLCVGEYSTILKKNISFTNNTKILLDFIKNQYKILLPSEDFITPTFLSFLGISLIIPNIRIFKYPYVDRVQLKIKEHSEVENDEFKFVEVI